MENLSTRWTENLEEVLRTGILHLRNEYGIDSILIQKSFSQFVIRVHRSVDAYLHYPAASSLCKHTGYHRSGHTHLAGYFRLVFPL